MNFKENVGLDFYYILMLDTLPCPISFSTGSAGLERADFFKIKIFVNILLSWIYLQFEFIFLI